MKLLMLGTTGRGTKELLLEAKRRGIYTIVTDNLSVEKAPLKLLADEYWMISTADIDVLEEKCREEGVTAIMNGIGKDAFACRAGFRRTDGPWDSLLKHLQVFSVCLPD